MGNQHRSRWGQVQNILGENTTPILPVTGWKEFPSSTIPESFCYGSIYQHIISSAKLYDPKTGQSSPTLSTDFNTSKPMKKGREYFVSGHVTQLLDSRKGDFQFYKAVVLASNTMLVKLWRQMMHNVSVRHFFQSTLIVYMLQ